MHPVTTETNNKVDTAIPFNKPYSSGNEMEIIAEVVKQQKFCGDGSFTKKCNQLLEDQCHTVKALLTTSCTHALEMAALLLDIKEGDEVIMPSFTFVSTANAFVLRGAKIVFTDIRPDTMNLDEQLLEQAITSRTKAIVPVHYAGVSCEMDVICSIAKQYNLAVIEDAAQGLGASYKNKPLGSIGALGALSFHETKNLHCGEGGAILINQESFISRSEILREKGTDRSRFLRGMVDKYTWVDVGSSYLPSELNAAILLEQLQHLNEITAKRIRLWSLYNELLLPLSGHIGLPFIPNECSHNGHLYYIKCKNGEERGELISYLKEKNIQAVFHYIPLHTSPAGIRFGRFAGEDRFTTIESDRLLRLPMYYDLSESDVERIASAIKEFYKNRI